MAYETQLRSDRAELHRRVAAAIEEHSAGSVEENAALIAEHLETAGDLHEAFGWHMRAGAWLNYRDAGAARVSWDRARRVADALPTDDPGRARMRIAARTMVCATEWRFHSNDGLHRFEELRELCAQVDDKTSLAFAMNGPLSAHAQLGEVPEAQRMASELTALLDSIGDPALTAQAGFGAMGVKALQAGEMGEVLLWAEATIDWADGDPAKGGLVVSSPLAVALTLRGLARSSFGRSGWRKDFDDAVGLAEQSGDPLTLAVVVSFAYGVGIWTGTIRADDVAVRTIETALRTAEAYGDNYGVDMIKFVLGAALLFRGVEGDRAPGLDMLGRLRETWIRQRYGLTELPVLEVYVGQEKTRGGDLDGGIRLLRKSLQDMWTRGQSPYYTRTTCVLAEALLDRGADGDIAEAEAAIARLAAEPSGGSVIVDVWLLRMRALLARAQGDDVAYRDYRDRYRAAAASFGLEGHMDWAEAMP